MRIEKIKLSASMYEDAKAQGKSFSDVLQEQAVKENKFSVDAADKGIDVLGQQLAARDLKISGAQASFVEDFFKTNDSKILFPEVISRAVKTGLDDRTDLIPSAKELVATRTGIDSNVYSSAAIDFEESKATSKRVAEGKEFPKVKISFKEKAIYLHKKGYEIDMTYEAARRLKMNYFAAVMKQLGRNINREKVALIVETLINGDGNGNPISQVSSQNTSLAYKDIIALKYAAKKFNLAFMLSNEELAMAYECLPEYTSKNGPKMPAPPKVADSVPAKNIIALDGKAAIEEVYEKGASIVEYDKVINKQFETAVISEVVGYAIMFRDAAKMLKLA